MAGVWRLASGVKADIEKKKKREKGLRQNKK
jgi:hypothetical protein